jgi:hypothetical protein
VPLLKSTRQHRSELARGIGCTVIPFSWVSWVIQASSRSDRWPSCINRNSGRATRFS